MHERDIVHRDIKPANMLLTSADALDTTRRRGGPAVVKLADFGIARLADATRLTMTGMTLGTMSYLSPEQATGGELGPASDVYGLGLVLLECATGRPAFTGTMAEVATARLVAPPEVPADLDPARRPALAHDPDGTRRTGPTPARSPRSSTRILAGATDETLVLPAVDGAVPPPPRRLGRLRSRRVGLAAGAMVLLASGALLVGQLTAGDDAPIAPPSYPAVEGSVGESLTDAAEERRAMRCADSLDRRASAWPSCCAGCGSEAGPLGRSRARAPGVRARRHHAASEARWSDAQLLLVDTQAALDAGADAGEVSTARYRTIDAALERVAAELAAAQAAADQAAAQQAAADQAAAEQAAAEQAAAEQAAADAAAAQKAADAKKSKGGPKPKEAGPVKPHK